MKKRYIIMSSLIGCIALYIIEQILLVDYLIKTLSKIGIFILIPYLSIRFIKESRVKASIQVKKDKKHFKLGILFGLASFVVVLITYYLLQDIIDLQGIANELENKSKITPSNFILIGLYITFGNSFLEEFFFRGFIFLNLYKLGHKKLAYIYSSLLFGLYHIAIFQTWFHVGLIGLALLGLVAIGLVFNWLDTKSDNFINSWIVHILADSAIILIGLRMFRII